MKPKNNRRQTPISSEARLDRPAHLEQHPGTTEAGSAQNHTTRPRMSHRFSDSPEAPRHKASDEPPILRFARGPVPRGLGRALSYRLARGRLGINPITAALTDFSDRMSHPTNASNHSHDVSRTTARYGGVADETGVTSTPCHPGQDGTGVTGCCARHYAHG